MLGHHRPSAFIWPRWTSARIAASTTWLWFSCSGPPDSLHYTLSNAATCIATADLEVMTAYAALVEDRACRSRVFALVAEEFDRTSRMLERIYRGPLAERRPNIHKTVQMRQLPLRVLHDQQIALLREWRGPRRHGDLDVERALLPALLMTVNAIASGLGATG